MGMMLRRHERQPDTLPMVNGKPVKKEPKTKSLTEKTDVPHYQPYQMGVENNKF